MGFMIDVFANAGDWLHDWLRPLSTDENDLPVETVSIDWIGGPFDGFTRPVDPADVWHLPAVLEMPVSRQLYDPFEHRQKQKQIFDTPTSVAVYQLEFDADRWFYRFDHARPTNTSPRRRV